MEKALLQKANHTPITLPAGNDHPVVDIPFTAIIDGRQFRGRGLSLVAAYVSGLMDPQVLNATRIVRLIFQFDGFLVTLVVDAEVREHTASSGEAELIFTHPTGPHLPQLRHVLNAFIAGDLVGLGQAIGVAGTAAPRASKPGTLASSRMSLRRVAGGFGIVLLTAGLIGIAGTLTYQRMFVTLVPTLGTVVTTGEVMRATTTGQIVFLDLAAGEGEVAVAIQAASGDVQSLVMPCDCIVTAEGLGEGSTVLIGEPLLQLIAETDQTVVAAIIPPDMLFELGQAERVDLTFPDGTTTQATPLSGSFVVGAGSVQLLPTDPIDNSQLGQPVEIRVHQDRGRIGDLYDALALGFNKVVGAA